MHRANHDVPVLILGHPLISPGHCMGPVDQVEVDVVQTQIPERPPQRGLNVVLVHLVGPQFGRHEDVFSLFLGERTEQL